MSINPDHKITEKQTSKSHTPADRAKFKEAMEQDSSQSSVAKLKKHAKGLDEETADLEELQVKDDETPPLSLFDLASSKKQKQPKQPEPLFAQQQPLSEKETIKEAPQQQPHIAALPDALPQRTQIEVPAFQVEAKPYTQQTSPIQDIVNQMIKEVQTIEMQGKTETVVSLNHPKMFEGASVIVTSFDSARGEFNIRFENLTQQAKLFLDSGQHLTDLKTQLNEKGYTTHIISTSTLQENSITAAEEASTDNRSRQEEQEENSEKKRQWQDEPAEDDQS